jgi:hypothetical protein
MRTWNEWFGSDVSVGVLMPQGFARPDVSPFALSFRRRSAQGERRRTDRSPS